MTPEEFARLGALFDDLVDAPAADQDAALAELRTDAPTLAARLEAMFAAEKADQALLDGGASAVVATPEPLTQVIGPYRLLDRLGAGGMGEVFLAERVDGQFEQKVAVKLLRAGLDAEAGRRRFVAERQILADLTHPNIARLLDGGVLADGRPWFAMELVDGEDLLTWLARSEPSLDARLDLFETICDAVHFAHTRLVVHRDLKPDNILVDASNTPKLLDFGIAKILEPQSESQTRAGDRLMTPSWASPEQMQAGTITTATDVYALGMVLYQLLSETHAHGQAQSLAELESIVCTRTPPPPSEVLRSTRSTWRRSVRGDLDTVCMKALRKEPERRYQSVAAFAEDVRRYRRAMPVSARPDTTSYRVAKFVRRNRGVLGALGAVGLGFGITIGVFTARLADERDRAQSEARKAQATVTLLSDVFEGVDPAFAKGREVTAETLLTRGLAQAETLDAQPAVQATLRGVIGRAFRSIGKRVQAVEALRLAVDGHADPEARARAQIDLGSAIRARGEWAEARQILESVDVTAWPALQPKLAYELGLIGLEESKIPEARQHFTRALTLTPPPKLAADIRTGLALAAYNADDLKGAEAEYRTALALYRSTVGDLHPQTAATWNDLAASLRHQGRYDEAEEAYGEALRLGRALFGDAHPDLALTLNHLGRLAQNRGRFAEAEPLLREALAMRKAVLPAGHPAIGASQGAVAGVLMMTGRYAEAEGFFRKMHAGFAKSAGPKHPYTAAGLQGVGLALMRQSGKEAEAERWLRRSLALSDQVFGPKHRRRTHPRFVLGDLLVRTGRNAEAEPLLREAWTMRAEIMGPDHKDTARVRAALAQCTGDIDALCAAIAVLKKALDADHPHLKRAQARLGSATCPAQ